MLYEVITNKGFIGMLPILLGAIVGYLVSMPFGLVNFDPVGAASWFVVPVITSYSIHYTKLYEHGVEGGHLVDGDGRHLQIRSDGVHQLSVV